MHNTGKEAPKPMKPSPNPGAVPNEPDRFAQEHDHGEGSYSGTRDYQKGVKAYLERANVETDARKAAPENADVERELEDAEETGRSGGLDGGGDSSADSPSRKGKKSSK